MSALRLEWKHSPGEEFSPESWHVPVDAIGASVMESGDVYEWSVHFTSGAEPTLLAAQLAAEAAALELLANALAHFGEPGVNGQWNIAQIGNDPTVYVRMPDTHLMGRRAECISPADATRLACALLAAARVKP